VKAISVIFMRNIDRGKMCSLPYQSHSGYGILPVTFPRS